MAQTPDAPCVTCVALLIDAAGAEATLQAGLPMAGLDLAVARESEFTNALVERLARAGARVWLTTDARATVMPPERLAFATGVFLVTDAAADVNDSVFAVRRSATELRALRPELRVGVVLTPALVRSEGASGVAFARAVERLGIAEQVKAKYKDTGTKAGEMVAAGDIELAAAQIPELLAVPGVDVIGPLPAELQTVTIFSVGLTAEAGDSAAARALIEFLAGPRATPVYKAKGLGG